MRAFLTGGHGDIGYAILNYLLNKNYETTVFDKESSRFKSLIQSNNLYVEQLDLLDTEKIKTSLSQQSNPVDVLVYAAGIREILPFINLTLEDWRHIQDINLTSAFTISQHFIKLALENRRPLCVIFISSISGLYGEPERSAYCASKHGLVGLTKALALELATEKIRINTIAPGVINTEMTRPYKQSIKTMKNIQKNIPLGKWGEPHHIVQSVDYIIQNDYVTGSVLVVDGGWTAGKIL